MTKLKQIYALAAGAVPCSEVAVALYPARRFRRINIIKPISKRPPTAAIIIIIGNQPNPFLAGGAGLSVPSIAPASVD